MKSRREMIKFMPGVLWIIFLSGCIHEYPYATKDNPGEKGEDPTVMQARVEVTYNLSWQSIMHHVDFNTKAGNRSESPHRFVIEVIRDEETIYHEIQSLTSNEFSSGKLTHKLSQGLEPDLYRIGVWYDMEDDNGEYSFQTHDLKEIQLSNFSTTDAEFRQCAYASDVLDLRNVDREDVVVKELELSHAGARFEIIATDVQQFITNNKASLNQGDSFTVHLSFAGGTSDTFNLHSQSLRYKGENMELSGWMRLPFAEYDELKIAEGFLFCAPDEEVTVRLSVTNSALLPVCQTEYFSFPVKRGYITSVRGDFLTDTIDGIFSVNHIWDGEIVIEI